MIQAVKAFETIVYSSDPNDQTDCSYTKLATQPVCVRVTRSCRVRTNTCVHVKVGGSRVLETVGDPVIGRYKVKHTVTLALLSLVFLKLRIAQPVTQVMYHFAADKCVCTRLDAAG